MVVVDVAIAAGPDEIAHLEAGLLGKHVGQRRIGGDIKGHAQEHIRRALVDLQRQRVIGHVELEEQVAGHKCHLVELRYIPCRDQVAARIRVILQGVKRLLDLVDVAPIRGGPRAPLHAVDRAQIAILIGPLVPDAHVIILQEFHIGIAAQEPQQLADDPAEVDLLCG